MLDSDHVLLRDPLGDAHYQRNLTLSRQHTCEHANPRTGVHGTKDIEQKKTFSGLSAIMLWPCCGRRSIAAKLWQYLVLKHIFFSTGVCNRESGVKSHTWNYKDHGCCDAGLTTDGG